MIVSSLNNQFATYVASIWEVGPLLFNQRYVACVEHPHVMRAYNRMRHITLLRQCCVNERTMFKLQLHIACVVMSLLVELSYQCGAASVSFFLSVRTEYFVLYTHVIAAIAGRSNKQQYTAARCDMLQGN